MKNDIKYLAFYLPQYYETKENNKWWGKGYTEWTGVKNSKKLFEGHNQPRTPHSDLGFYDLSNVNNMIKQAQIAKKYGVHGFCYFWYWSNGKRLLNLPVENMLKTPEVDIPFCFCWANHSWTRTWEAKEKAEVLWPQKYSRDFYEKFIDDLIPYFSDPRYIKINGKNVLLIYLPQKITNAKTTLVKMKSYAKERYNSDLYLIACQNIDNIYNPEEYGCDAALEYGPSWSPKYSVQKYPKGASKNLNLLDYRILAQDSIIREENEYKLFNSVFCDFDNSPRRKDRNPTILLNNTNENFEIFLSEISKKVVEKHAPNERLVFINAWNEWGESCYLEPDTKNGYSKLEIVKKYSEMPSEELKKVNNNAELYNWLKLLFKMEKKDVEIKKDIAHLKGKLYKDKKFIIQIYKKETK